MIAIIDYGVGNLFSLKSSLKEIGAEAVVTADEKVIADCDRIILPGVGAFEDAARKLRESGMADVVKKEAAAGKPKIFPFPAPDWSGYPPGQRSRDVRREAPPPPYPASVRW